MSEVPLYHAWCMVYVVWCMVNGMWCMVCGVWVELEAPCLRAALPQAADLPQHLDPNPTPDAPRTFSFSSLLLSSLELSDSQVYEARTLDPKLETRTPLQLYLKLLISHNIRWAFFAEGPAHPEPERLILSHVSSGLTFRVQGARGLNATPPARSCT